MTRGVLLQCLNTAANIVKGVLNQRVAGHPHLRCAAEAPPDLLHLRGGDTIHIHETDERMLLDAALDLVYLFLLPPGQVLCIECHQITLTAGPMVVFT